MFLCKLYFSALHCIYVSTFSLSCITILLPISTIAYEIRDVTHLYHCCLSVSSIKCGQRIKRHNEPFSTFYNFTAFVDSYLLMPIYLAILIFQSKTCGFYLHAGVCYLSSYCCTCIVLLLI